MSGKPRYVALAPSSVFSPVGSPIALSVRPCGNASDIGLSPDLVGKSGAKISRVDYFVPDFGEGAEILEGDTSEILEKLIEILQSKGGIK